MGTTRDIYNYLGVKIGEIELPSSTTEDEWTAKLAEYSAAPKTQEQIAKENLAISITDRKTFGDELMEEFKLKNISDGIAWYQAMHLHSRIRAWEVTLPPALGSVVVTVDLLNMIVSGDIETASLALLYGANDAMSSPLHWITNERRVWLINKMRAWLQWPLV